MKCPFCESEDIELLTMISGEQALSCRDCWCKGSYSDFNPEWTEEDNESSLSKGWGVFLCDDGINRIQRLDEADLFADDDDAIAFVENLKLWGHATAAKALRLHGKPD